MRNGSTPTFLVALFISLLCSDLALGQSYEFSWDRATLYSIATDQFQNGDPSNDPTDRRSDAESLTTESARPVGGDFAGIVAKIEEGYFSNLGVQAICISMIHPRVSTGDRYSSVWSLDYTEIAAAYGTVDEFKRLIESAHEQNLRVIMEVALPERGIDLAIDSLSVDRGPMISEIFHEKWGESGSAVTTSLVEFFMRSGHPIRSEYAAIHWLTHWVRTFGVDAFHVGGAEMIETDVLSALKAEGIAALRKWKSEHPAKSKDELDFWLMADVLDHGPEKSAYHDAGVDATTNFGFASGEDDLESIYADYSATLAADPTYNIVSFVSSGETTLGERRDLFRAGTELFLLPGIIQIHSGDDTATALSVGGRVAGDSLSPMNWDGVDKEVRIHWTKLAQFRARHPSIAQGVHEKISDEPYAFYRGVRIGLDVDEVIVVIGAAGRVRLNVSRYFPDDTILRDAYTGKITMISYGEATFETGDHGVLLLELVQ